MERRLVGAAYNAPIAGALFAALVGWQFFDEFIRAAGDVFSGRDDGVALLVRDRSLVCFAKKPSRNVSFSQAALFPKLGGSSCWAFFPVVWCFFPKIHSESGSDVRQARLAKLG